MENLKKILDDLQAAEDAKKLTAEQRAAELAEIEGHIRNMSKALHELFNRKAELEAADEEARKEQEDIDRELRILQDFYSKK